jgi:hypothetical protein
MCLRGRCLKIAVVIGIFLSPGSATFADTQQPPPVPPAQTAPPQAPVPPVPPTPSQPVPGQPGGPPLSQPGAANAAQVKQNQAHAADIQAAQQVALAWIGLVDRGKYDDSWKQFAPVVQQQITKKQWKQQVKSTRKAYGALQSRTPRDANYATTLPGAPDGKYVVLEFDTTFANKQAARETCVLAQTNGAWKVAGYFLQ